MLSFMIYWSSWEFILLTLSRKSIFKNVEIIIPIKVKAQLNIHKK
jgi:hypothetical protein